MWFLLLLLVSHLTTCLLVFFNRHFLIGFIRILDKFLCCSFVGHVSWRFVLRQTWCGKMAAVFPSLVSPLLFCPAWCAWPRDWQMQHQLLLLSLEAHGFLLTLWLGLSLFWVKTAALQQLSWWRRLEGSASFQHQLTGCWMELLWTLLTCHGSFGIFRAGRHSFPTEGNGERLNYEYDWIMLLKFWSNLSHSNMIYLWLFYSLESCLLIYEVFQKILNQCFPFFSLPFL